MQRWTYVLALGFGGLLALGSCRSYGDYCTEMMDCMGGNDADIESCEIALAASRDFADEKGCEESWDDFHECLIDQSSCTNDVWNIGQGDCEDEQNDCSSCGCGLGSGLFLVTGGGGLES